MDTQDLENLISNDLPEAISPENRQYILDLIGGDFDIEKYTPIKKTSWPIRDRRSGKKWDDDVRQAALRVIREGKPIDEIEFREGDKMKNAVITYLLGLAGYEADE